MPGFGLEVSWNGSVFLGEIFSSPRRETFFSCPNSEKLQGRLFFVFHREGEFSGYDKTKRGWQELYGSCPISHRRPLSVVSLLWDEEGEDLYGFLLCYLTTAL